MHYQYLKPGLYSFIFLLLLCCKTDSIEKYSIKKGTFKASITETGELEAIESKVIPMPYLGWRYGWRFKILRLAEHGQRISAGDTVVVIDPSSVIRELEEETNKLESEQANLEKLYATHDSQISQLQSELASEKANWELISLQLDKFSFESDKKKLLKKLELEIASIKLRDLEKKYEKKKVIFDKEIQIQLIKLEQIQKNIDEAQRAFKKLDITSPINGIVQLERNRRTKMTVQVGDEIHQGQSITRIPDMSKMKVQAKIGESDYAKIYTGQETIVRLDAYPEKSFHGKVQYIGKLSREKNDNPLIKVFDFDVILDESDEALKPGMTVSCELIIDEIDEALYVENECIFRDTEGYFVRQKSSLKRVPIELVSVNNNYSAISGDIKKGQKLISIEEYNQTETTP
jgi:multidrug efflux pump subunit AcrA (membrane-fusion protein)